MAKVMEMRADGETLAVRAGVGWKAGVVGVVTLKVSDLTSEGHALKTGEPTTSPDIDAEKRFRYPAFLTDHGVRAIANVLIPAGKGRPPFGILQVDSRVPRVFTDHDLTFLRSYANLLAPAVDRLRVVDELRQREARLRESEARLDRAISAAGMGTWEWEAVSDTVRFFPSFEALHVRDAGAPPAPPTLDQVVHPEDWPAVTAALHQTLKGENEGRLATEFRVVLQDDAVHWLRVTGSAEHGGGGAPNRVAGFTQDITTSRDAEKRILHMARHDGLTGLLNRYALRERLEDALLRTRRGEGCAVLALDLDRFKEVNDTLGHAVGDAVLRSVATRLLEVARETDVVARPGGDEFVVIQFGLHQPRDAEALAARIVATLGRPHEIDGQKVGTGVSIGIAVAPEDGADVEQVLRCADLALYGAKGDDADRFRFFEPGMQVRTHDRRQLLADLRKALARGEFELHYQPLVELALNRIVGFEALVRWRHPVRGLVLPGAFIAVAEETGLIEPLGEWILGKACADAANWPPEMKVAVNLSVVQFSKGNLHATVAAALEKAELMPQRLELEITESLLLQETETTLAVLRRLRERGVSIAMDDFGIGYSSLSHLSRFPFDRVKIDRSFVATAGPGTSGAAIIRAVSELCRSLGITTTAEGIETIEHLQQVVSLGCTEGQGYFFARPCPAVDIPALLIGWPQSDRSGQ